MPFPTDDIFLLDNDPQHTWGKRPSTAGIIFHTTEGSGPSRNAALATAQWQNGVPGSYNFIIYDATSAGAKGGALLTVPYDEACGGINPGSDAWAPEDWLRGALPSAAFSDPTMYHLQLSFSGKARELEVGKYPRNMLRTAARLVIWAEDRYGGPLVLSAHEDWQTNRSDPGMGVIRQVKDIVARMRAAEPEPVEPPIDYKALYEEQLVIVDRQRKIIRALRGQIAALRADRDALQSQLDVALAKIEAAKAELA